MSDIKRAHSGGRFSRIRTYNDVQGGGAADVPRGATEHHVSGVTYCDGPGGGAGEHGFIPTRKPLYEHYYPASSCGGSWWLIWIAKSDWLAWSQAVPGGVPGEGCPNAFGT